ncbi:hypothetical protein NLJ89_g5481 [Agrocybe chaxingu]|uniref:Anaphase-promoting complex subunit 4 long domain-containing protein n=1 Tax=Agrocybe chaxingu TaxID=84603 RepID=A0A9W8MWW3_9AGAR|nr:hypothetical protein NLJ89_g5481 [Agrocybe chaxingu]
MVNLPLLSHRAIRDFAKLSSTGRELTWYATCAVKEIRGVWYGDETNSGARELGPKWVRALEVKQRESFGQQNTSPVLDLTILLTTGRERGIQKWESVVSEALVKLRDFSEKRLAPAMQRLHLVIEEVHGWAKLPHFSVFQLSAEELGGVLDLASRGIILANWLAAESRKQLGCFKEFIAWLRYEVGNVNSPNEGNVPRYDILEVNNYLTSGLVNSAIDSWFTGPVPQFRLRDLGIPEPEKDGLDEDMEYAREVANDPALLMAWQMERELNHVDKNLNALIEDLALRCQRVFHRASGAVSRSASISYAPSSDATRAPEKERSAEPRIAFPFRERTVLNEKGEVVQHLVVHMPSVANNTMLLTQLRFSVEESGLPSQIGVALLECYLPEEGQEDSSLDLLDADFFDDECVVIVYRPRRGQKQISLAMVNYSAAGYQNLPSGGYVTRTSQEDLIQESLELWKDGHLSSTKIAIMRHRTLSSCKDGGVSLALNGRTGRRVACVLDSTGTALESFDVEGEGDMEVADDGR